MEQTMIQPEWSKVAEVELVYKTKVKAFERPLITTSKDCYETLLKVWDQNKIEFQEEFLALKTLPLALRSTINFLKSYSPCVVQCNEASPSK